MKRLATAAVAASLAAGGCCLIDRIHARRMPTPQPPTYSQFHQDGFSWDRVNRVVVLPALNESEHTHAGEDFRDALTSELQRLGRFEVVAAPEVKAALAAKIHRGGHFDEAAMLEIAKYTNSDVVVHAIVTHFSPYPRPRIGVIIQAVGVDQMKVVASVDGLWDTTDTFVAERCRIYYRLRVRPRPPWIRNHVIVNDDGFAGEIALDSPALFQRWVCHEACLVLLGLPVPFVIEPGLNSPAPVVINGAKAGCASGTPAPAAGMK
jgi:hypothetical protein